MSKIVDKKDSIEIKKIGGFMCVICGSEIINGNCPTAAECLGKEIGDWQRSTFGEGKETIRGTVNKLKAEAEELSLALFKSEYALDDHVADEAADIGVLLIGLCNQLDLNLLAITKRKLEKNKARKWGARREDGSFQHVEEPGV